MMMMMKVGFIIVALVMVSVEISAKEMSPTLSPIEHSSSLPQPENEMSPSPTMSNDYDYPSSSQFTEASHLNNYTGNTRTGGKKASGGKKTGIVVGAIAAVSMVGFGGYVLKKRRDNIRRSWYGYAAATEFF